MTRPFTIVDAPQRSEAWFKARCGLVTGSVAGDMLAKIKEGEAAKRRDLRTRLVLERLTGVTQEDGFVNDDMKRGTALEHEALLAYEGETGELVQSVGFLRHNEWQIGHSPDGIIQDFAGFVEMKVPRSATHLGYLRGDRKTVPPAHYAQMLHGFLVTGASFADFCSWDPRFPEPLRLFRVRVKRSDFDVMAYERSLLTFLGEIDREYDSVRQLEAAAVA